MSLFSRVLEVRDKFKELSISNLNFVSSILNEDFDVGSKSFIVSNDVYGSIINDGVIGNPVRLEFRNTSNDELLASVPNISDLSQYQDMVVDQLTGQTIRDSIAQASSTASLYDALSNVTGKFGYLNRMKFDNMVTILQTGTYQDISNLIQSLSMGVDDEGFISVNSFFAVINSYFSVLNSAVDNDTPVLDVTNPYRVIDLVSIIVDVAQTIFSVLMIVLKGVYRVVAAAIAIVAHFFSTIFSTLKEKQSTVMDINASNTFVLGPILAAEYEPDASYGTGLISRAIPYYTTDKHHIYYKESVGLGVFSWFADFESQDQNYRRTRCNAYLYPNINVRDLKWYQIFDRYTVSSNQFKYFFLLDAIQDPESPYYLPASGPLGSGWPMYGENSVPLDGREATLSLAFDYFIRLARFAKGMTDKFSSVAHGIWEIQFCGQINAMTDFIQSTAEMWNQGGWLKWLFSIIENIYNYNGYENFVNRCSVANSLLDHLADDFAVFIRDKVMATNTTPFMEFTSFTASPQPWESHESTVGLPDSYPKLTTPLFCGSDFIRIEDTPEARLVFVPFNSNADVILVDCLPAAFGIKLPTISTTELISTLATVGVIITAAVLATAAVAYKVTKMNISKRALKAQRIASLRENFLNNPTNKAARKAYENAVFKYNLFGSVFGFGSYDGRNGWFDSGSSQSNDYQYSFDNILSRNNEVKQSIGSPSTDLNTLINQIKLLIKA